MKSQMHHRQQGAALITALIFLIVLTLVAVTSVQNVTLQEQMTSAVRQGSIALEVAEVGLRDAEAFLMGLPNSGAFLNSGDWTYDRNQAPRPWAMNWNGNGVREAGAVIIDGVEYPVRYLIEYIGPMAEQMDTGEIQTGGSLDTLGQNEGYRIVARGLGNDGVTERIVEAYVARTFQ